MKAPSHVHSQIAAGDLEEDLADANGASLTQ